jgi:hypothetical protein
MKKSFTLSFIAALFIFTSSVSSQLLLEENFNYPAGDSIGAHGWISFSGGSTNVLTVVSPGLTYSGYPPSGIGNAVQLFNTGQDSYKQLSESEDSGEIYAACMVNVSNAQTGDYFMMFIQDNSTTNFRGRAHVRLNEGQINFGITKGANSDVTEWGSTNYELNTTYIVVLKYKFIAGLTNDEVSLFVFSSTIPANEPTPEVGPSTFPSPDAIDIARFGLRQGAAVSSATLVLDGIRVFTEWEKIITVSVNPISSIAEDFRLHQNFPNPFNPSTTIRFSVPGSGKVLLNVYNSLGQYVSGLANTNVTAGIHSVDFNAQGLNSGVYFYTLTYSGANGIIYTDSKKLLLIK